jgi:hypothetical protein
MLIASSSLVILGSFRRAKLDQKALPMAMDSRLNGWRSVVILITFLSTSGSLLIAIAVTDCEIRPGGYLPLQDLYPPTTCQDTRILLMQGEDYHRKRCYKKMVHCINIRQPSSGCCALPSCDNRDQWRDRSKRHCRSGWDPSIGHHGFIHLSSWVATVFEVTTI